MAVLSTRGPMAVLSRQKQPDGQTSRFQRQIAFSLLSRKQAQLPFYQREAQWPFYQGRSNRMARPPDFSEKLHFRYYPARSVYQRPSQAILRKSRRNCRFIKAEATGWPNLQISATNCIFAIIPQGQAILRKSRRNCRFIKAEATGWPNLQISTTNCIFAIIPHDQFISGRAKLFSAKAGSMAVLSTRANGRFIKSSNRVTPRAALQIWQLRRFRLRPNTNKTATEAGWP